MAADPTESDPIRPNPTMKNAKTGVPDFTCQNRADGYD